MLTEQQNPNTSHIDRLSTQEMLTVINQQDASIARTVAQAIPQITLAVDAIVERLQAGGRLIYIGAGTSGRMGILDAVECVPTYGTPPALVQGIIAGGYNAIMRSVEGAEDSREGGRDDLMALNPIAPDCVVGIAASGRTPYVLGAIELANEIDAASIGIACNDPSPLLEAAQIAIPLPVGPEVVTGSTRMKAGTAQKLVLNMLSTGTMIKLGKVYGNLMVDVQPTNEKLVDRASRIIAQVVGVSYEQAVDLLKEAGNNVKVAIVMGKLSVPRSEAKEKLEATNGHLHAVIG